VLFHSWVAFPLAPAAAEGSELTTVCRAGLDLLTIGLGKTSMLAAICHGLHQAGVSYTLPPSKGGGPADASQMAAIKMRAAGVADGSADAVAAGNAQDDPVNGQNASAAAANLLMFS
jgi:hypothetical protein